MIPVCSIDKVFNDRIRNLGLFSAYTKNWVMSWSDDKELSSGANAIKLKLSKKKKKNHRTMSYQSW